MRRRSSGSSCWSLGARARRSRVSLVRLASLPCSTGPLQTPLVTLCPSLMMYVAADAQEIIRSELRESPGKGAAKSSVARARGTRASLRLVCLLPPCFCLSLFISARLSLSLSPPIKFGSTLDQVRINFGSSSDQVRIKFGSSSDQVRINFGSYFDLTFVCFFRLRKQNVDTSRTRASTRAMTSAATGDRGMGRGRFFHLHGGGYCHFFSPCAVIASFVEASRVLCFLFEFL